MSHGLSGVGASPTLSLSAARVRSGIGRVLIGYTLWVVATAAHAQVVPIDYYRLGEADSPNTGIMTGNSTDSAGNNPLPCPAGPSYSTDVALSAANATGSNRSVFLFTAGVYCSTTLLTTAVDNFGLEAWVKTTSGSGSHFVAYNGNSGFSGWGFVQNGTSYQALFGGVTTFGSGPASIGGWNHLAVVRDNGVATFYVDGVASGTTTLAPNSPNGSFALGAAPPAFDTFFVGYLDEVRAFTFSPGTFSPSQLLLNSRTVTTTADSGAGSLRAALQSAPAGSTITIQATGTITLASPLSPIRSALTINGPGASSLTISGANAYRVLFVDAPGASVSINNLNIANGLAKGGNGGNGTYGGGGGLGAGGGLFVNAGDVVLSKVSFNGNAAVGGTGGSAIGGGGGGGGGLGGNGGGGFNYSGGGGGGYYGNGASATNDGGGGGGGVLGNGGNGGNGGGGGGGALSGGQAAVGTAGGAGADAIGGNGASSGSGNGNKSGGAGLLLGGGGGGGYGHASSGYSGGDGGAGGVYGGGGGADQAGSGGAGGDFGGGGGFKPLTGTYADGSGGGNGGFGGGGGGGSSLICPPCRSPSGNGGFGAAAGAGAYDSLPSRGTSGPFAGSPGGANGQGTSSGSGGGAALGAAVFVRGDNAASLTWLDGSVDSGLLTAGTAGTGGTGASAGSTRGSSMFLLGGTTTISVSSGQQSIAGSIAGWTGALPGLIKNGNGTLVISSGANVDLGTFQVARGELTVNGLLPATLSVDGGATLSGNGSATGAVTLATGARVAPGEPAVNAGIDTLDTGALTWNGAATMAFQLGATAVESDQLLVSGNMTKAGTGFQFNFSDGAAAPACGILYTLIQFTGTTTFVPGDFSYTYSGANASFATGGAFSFDASGKKLQFKQRCNQVVTNFAATPASPVFSAGGTFALSATKGAGSSPLVFASASTSVCTVSGSTATMVTIGTCALTANQAADTNYNAAPQVTLDVTIGKGNQTITNFAATPAAPVFSSAGTFTVSATMGASTSPLVFASTSTSVCTVSGSTVTMLSTGTCALTADQAGDGNYNAAPQATLNVTIGKGSQTITNFVASPSSPVFSNGGTFSISATQGASTSALVFASSSTNVCTVNGSTVTILAAGSCVLTANQAGDGNYNAAPQVGLSVTIARGNPTITNFAATPANPVFGSGTFIISATSGGSTSPLVFASTSSGVCVVTGGSTVMILTAGTCALTADQAGDSNYNAAPQAHLDVTIAEAGQTITDFVSTPTTPVFSAGGTFFVSATPGASSSPLVFASTSAAICTISGVTVTMHAAGVCTLTANQAGDGDYSAAPQATLSVTIAKADQTITDFAATPGSLIFSPGATFVISAEPGASTSALVFGSTSPGICTVSGTTVTVEGAGTCALTANQAGDGNYNAAPQVMLNVVIAKAEQAITNFVSTPAVPMFHPGGTFTVSATPGASGNPLMFGSITSSVCTVTDSTVTMLTAGTCSLTASEAGDSNYNEAPTATLDVTLAQHTVTATSASSNGTITPATQQVNDGDIATFTVVADAGFTASVIGDTCTVTRDSDNAWNTGAITTNCHVIATFDDTVFADGFDP